MPLRYSSPNSEIELFAFELLQARLESTDTTSLPLTQDEITIRARSELEALLGVPHVPGLRPITGSASRVASWQAIRRCAQAAALEAIHSAGFAELSHVAGIRFLSAETEIIPRTLRFTSLSGQEIDLPISCY